MSWPSLLSSMPEYRSLLDATRKRYKEIVTTGLSGGANAFVLSNLLRDAGRPALWIVPGAQRAEKLLTELRCWWPEVRAGILPAAELLPYHYVAEGDELGNQRLQVMGGLAAGDLDVVIVPAPALLNRLVPLEVVQRLQLHLEPGTILPPDDLAARLVELGYEPAAVVEKPGQFASRGGIVDVFPPSSPDPVRIEWFDDEIDSLRVFNVENQRTVDLIDRTYIGPAHELVLTPEARDRAIEAAVAGLEQLRSRGESDEQLEERVTGHIDALQSGRPFPAMAWYLAHAYPDAGGVAGWMPRDAVCIVEEWFRVKEALEDRAASLREQLADFIEAGMLLPSHAGAYLDVARARDELDRLQRVYLLALPRRLEHVNPAALISFQSRPVPSFRSQWELLASELKAWQQSRRRTVLTVSDGDKGERLAEILDQHQVRAALETNSNGIPEPGRIAITPLALPEGFELDSAGLVVLSEQELTGRPVRRRRRRSSSDGIRISDYTELNEGDYVVHSHHGVGRYVGVKTMEIQGVRRDYLVLEYLRGDRLYVPVDQIELVQKYVGSEGREPKLSKLGGAEWGRIKERVQRSVRQMAEELLQLYAAREASVGYAFSPDGAWQREFEDAFPYAETEDQLRAIEEIKRDMESQRPMDRLLCGDVGFGKTEVAMRAAFKAVADGKQVAVLVPTTILAQQHYKSFVERFAPFPVTIRMLSRFQSVAEHAEILTGLRKGTIDIVIATHRLVQGDIAFKDLGLLVIDEEHRFGVAQKERIKQIKHNVDVLSLTATPIPRTLHMALSSLRDMSVISTPPEDRYPVQTYVVEHSDAMIRDAIRRELARGGQVFYVHNRVHSIDGAAARVQNLVPEARIAVAHGQMDEDHLEKVMLDFLEGEYDVLVCTTIIESGLDIANVNTIIVENADHLGLAQLYQLRGRVGRSNRVAYAYFTYRPDKTLTEAAEKRLEALKNFTDLGSGFKLALKDLEIRGAGNILGPEQHGFIASVGFELYSQLLAEAVRELRGEQEQPKLQPSIDLRWDAYIPDDYVSDGRLKVDLYRRIESAQTSEDLAAVRDEMLDRFGPAPEPVWNLLLTADYRRRAAECGVVSIEQRGKLLTLDLIALPVEELQEAGLNDGRRGRRLTVQQGRHRVMVRMPADDRNTLRKTLSELFGDLERVAQGHRMKLSPSAKN